MILFRFQIIPAFVNEVLMSTQTGEQEQRDYGEVKSICAGSRRCQSEVKCDFAK